MNYKDPATGKTFAETVDAEMLNDLKAHSDLQLENKEAPDAISDYYRAFVADALYKNGISPTADPDRPTIPPAGSKGDLTTADVFDPAKITAVLDAAKTDPTIQAFLDDNKRMNAGVLIAKLAKDNPVLNVPDDPNAQPGTAQSMYLKYVDHLKADQLKIANDPRVIAYIAKMPPNAQNAALAKIFGPVALIGGAKDQREMVATLTNNMAEATGQPKLLVDSEFNFVKTPDGKSVVIDPDSGKYVALDADGKFIPDQKTGLPPSLGTDGKPRLDTHGNPVMLDKSGNEVVVEPNGTKLVLNPATNDVLQNPNSNNFITIDPKTGAAVELGADGKVVTDPATGTVKIADIRTGGPLVNSATGNFVVVDPATNAPAELNKTTGKIVTDANGNTVLVSPKTGSPVMNKTTNQPVVIDANAKLPVSINPQTGIKTIVNPLTGAPLSDAKTTGATVILDPQTNQPIAALTDKTTGNVIKDARGNIAQIDDFGHPVSIDPNTGSVTIVNAKTGLDVKDANGNTLTVDKTSGHVIAKDTAGKTVVEPKTGATILYNQKTGAPMGREDGWYTVLDPRTNLPVEVNVNTGTFNVDEQGRTLVIDSKTGAWLSDLETGNPVVIDPRSNLPVSYVDGKTVVNSYTGVPVKDAAGNTVTVDPTTNRAVLTGADGNPVKDPNSGGVLVVDPKTGEPVLGADGTSLQINPATNQVTTYDPVAKTFVPVEPVPTPLLNASGNQVKDAAGNVVAKDMSGNTVLLDAKTNLPIAEAKSGNLQIVDGAGKPVVTADGKAVVVDKATGNAVAVDATGKVVVDAAGNAKVYDAATGKQVVDAQGNRVVLDAESGAPMLTDKTTGAPLVEPQSGLTYAVDPKTGALIVDKVTGNTVVLDKEYKAPVLVGKDGKVVVDANGNAVMANIANGEGAKDRNGNFIVVDKTSGLPVVVDPQTGTRTMVDGLGNPLTDPASGATFEVNAKTGLPQLIKTDETGKKTVIDPATGKPMVAFDKEVYLDSVTGQMVVDSAKGMIDILTGEPPVVSAITPIEEQPTTDEVGKIIRQAMNSVYWNVWGTAKTIGALLDPTFLEKSDFYKTTAVFEKSRVVATISGIITLGLIIDRWKDGTPERERLEKGDQKAQIYLASDITSVMKYDGFLHPNTLDAVVKFFNDPVRFGGSGIKVAEDGTVFKQIVGKTFTYELPPGALDPVTGKVFPNGGTVTATNGYQIFLRKDAVDPLTGLKATTDGWGFLSKNWFDPAKGILDPRGLRPGTDPIGTPNANAVRFVTGKDGKLTTEIFNSLSKKWEPPGLPNALPKTVLEPTAYGKYAASSVAKAFYNISHYVMAAGNIGGGGLQIYVGIDKLIHSNGNGAKIASGVADVVAGMGYIGAGGLGLGNVLGARIVGETVIRLYGMLAGPLSAVAATFTLIALIIDVATTKPTYDQWAENFLKQFEGTDILKGSKDEIEKKLAGWYRTNISIGTVNVDQPSITPY